MARTHRVPNEQLVAAGLELMAQAGQPLQRIAAPGRAMIYQTPDGHTVRVRTCNDHVLVVVADRDSEGAKLNIEGTDYVLVVMPETPRSHGPVIAFLVPTVQVSEAARTTHQNWLKTKPNTKGDNKTWNLWFDEDGPPKANGFSSTWRRYQLQGSASTTSLPGGPAGVRKLGDVIADAKNQIAAVAGVPLEAVRISVDLA